LRRPAGGGARRISGHDERKRSLSVHLHRAAGDALRLATNICRCRHMIDWFDVRAKPQIFVLVRSRRALCINNLKVNC
jgi:hypothetical protein